MATSPIDFSGLSAEERLELIAELWDSLDPRELPPPTADEVAELERRATEARAHPEASRPWADVKRDLLRRLE